MNRRKLNYYHHRFILLKAWYLLLPAIIFALLAVYGLRSNYSTMVKLREAVYVTDQKNGDVETALQKLRAHVYGHMNTDLTSGNNNIKPPIQLKARYERLAGAGNENIKAANQRIQAQGEQICSAQFPAAGFNAPRVECIQDYMSANALKAGQIPDELYKFDFVSPRWSPDLAGLSILFSFIFFTLFAARVLLEHLMRKRLS
jgi:hypothetical protein